MKEYFSRDIDYKRFIFIKRIAKKINKFIDDGYFILFEDRVITKFKFKHNGKPCICEKVDNITVTWFCNTFDKNSKIVIEQTKKQINNGFKKFQFYLPVDNPLIKKQ